jgi:hypothetical protein
MAVPPSLMDGTMQALTIDIYAGRHRIRRFGLNFRPAVILAGNRPEPCPARCPGLPAHSVDFRSSVQAAVRRRRGVWLLFQWQAHP